MYLLDRSTYRRIGQRQDRSHVAALHDLHRTLDGVRFEHRGWSTGFIVLDGKALSIRGEDACDHLVLDADGVLLAHEFTMGKERAATYGFLIEQLKADGLLLNTAVTDGLPGFRKEMRECHLIHQRCHVHLLRDLRTGLQLTTKHRYKRLTPANRQKKLAYRYCHLLLRADPRTFRLRLTHITRVLSQNLFCLNPIQLQAVRRFLRGAQSAFWHFHDDRIPTTTNAAENYIGRIEARLKTMRGLKKFENTERILEALHIELNENPL
jgi:transposase-like protein